MKKLMFIVGTLNVGGIETYVSRLSKHLNKDFEVSILILSNKVNQNILKDIPNSVKIYYFSEYTFLGGESGYLNLILPSNYNKLSEDTGEIDYIHAVDSHCLIVGNELAKFYNAVILTAGIYHSQEYLWNSKYYFRSVQKRLFESLPIENILHCSDDKKDYITENNLIPILIDCSKYENVVPNYNSNKLISVGRLVDFKTYNKHVINLMNELSSRFPKIEYHIYGDGPELENLKKLATSKSEKVYFHGEVSYDEFPEVLAGSKVFIGSGTAIIESAAAGVPSVTGIESSSEPLTYGRFSSIPGFSYNELGLQMKTAKYIDEITKILGMNELQYKMESIRHRNKSSEFSIHNASSKFSKFFKDCKRCEFSFNRVRYSYSLFFWLLVNLFGLIKEKRGMYDK